MLRYALASFIFILVVIDSFTAERPNILFIAVDDLRPQINAYGKTFM